MKSSAIFFLLLLFLFSCASPRTVWLDELDMTNADQAAGITRVNQSMWRTPLVIAGDTLKRGIGTHAFGVIRVELDGKAKSFKAQVGIDDSAPEHELKQASVEFVVLGDNNILWRSGIMRAGDKAKNIDVSLKNIKSLVLRTDHAGDGIAGDRADWVNAKLEYTGKPPYTIKRPQEAIYIQTPPASRKPLLNAPYRYGTHPGCPIIFTIPVSGERPLKVEAKNLPAGLSLDTNTGIVTGKIKEKGTYTFDITATNTYGSDTHRFTFEVGEKLALTPPMGWNSWNVFGADIDDAKIRAMADAMVDLRLTDYGYAYINIDDGWQGKRGGKYHAIMPNEKFPDMKALVDYIHSKGLKVGIYSSPWVQTFAGFVGGSADTPEGEIINSSRRVGEYSFAENDVKQWAEWGIDYLKYDWVTNDIKNTEEMTDQLRKSGRNIVYTISNAAPFDLAKDWNRLTNAWRTTGDITDSWCSMTTIGFLQNKWQPYASPGSWNDPDMLVVGKVGWGDGIRQTNLSPDEQYVHISLWSILAAPLLMGCDLSKMDNFTLNLLKNREVIAVNQDILGIQGERVYKDDDKMIEVWSKPLSDGSQAVGLFNLGEKEQNISVLWEQLKITGNRKVRNLWKQEDIGNFDIGFSATVPSHGVTFVKISK
ncbi:NPCBM/NEW2 domain-containing protein [Dysgonomonas sp. 520]|uniref:NPCBM/NEW2 domain-containing protein n=1 Tax=Dysgonomonas sp. 520 TaxID=2302931 RepID=UPI0013D76218|nr:NPCBM/NEW2 domain-containing protein [Dysgonomonas sp. 520]NDW08551.1 alpha-galactosidase [Dysgonomonas sp. 520]